MKILQVVGFKNSGKTTITKEIISILVAKGLKVGSLKHHGHGGIPVGIENTDSLEHHSSGAEIAGVFGDHLLQLSSSSWNRKEMLQIYELLGIEILIVEGFKDWCFPKVVMLRSPEDSILLERLTNIIGVVTPCQLDTIDGYPVFQDGKDIGVLLDNFLGEK